MGKQANQRFTRQMADEYREELQRYLLRRLSRSGLDAGDITQETFLRLLRVEHTELIRKPRAYLYRVAVNVIREFQLKEQDSPLHGAVDIVATEDAIPAPSNSIDRVEHASSLTAALEGLPEMQRAALLLFKRDGKSYQEIAQELNLSSHTVKKYLFLAASHCRRQGWR